MRRAHSRVAQRVIRGYRTIASYGHGPGGDISAGAPCGYVRRDISANPGAPGGKSQRATQGRETGEAPRATTHAREMIQMVGRLNGGSVPFGHVNIDHSPD